MMNPSPIIFGASGWRGLLAEDFAFANVRLATAIAEHVKSKARNPTILVGYDARFYSQESPAAWESWCDEQKANDIKKVAVDASTLLGRNVVSMDPTDGAKFCFEDGFWMLLAAFRNAAAPSLRGGQQRRRFREVDARSDEMGFGELR